MSTTLTARQIRDRLETITPWREARGGEVAIAAALEVARSAPQELVDRLDGATRIVITGAGSSLYISQVAAFSMRAHANLPAEAQPLSEVLLRPDAVFAGTSVADQPLIVVSRSGTTTEALEVIKAARARGQHTIAVTCRPEAPMAGLADATLAVPEGDEEAIVMTRSFAAMVSLLMRLGARLGGDAFASDLDAMPAEWATLDGWIERATELAATNPSRLVVLGGGAAYGLANEAVLKATETSQVPASAFHPLEFRHGPMSVCEPGMAVVGILGGDAADAEARVVSESAALGASTLVVGPDGPAPGIDETARLPLVLHVLQALALGIAVVRGLDPEAPRHLGQVVVIEDE